MWGLGCLIWEVFNGLLNRTGDLKTLGKVNVFIYSISLLAVIKGVVHAKIDSYNINSIYC